MSAFPPLSEIWAYIEPRMLVLFLLTAFDLIFGVVIAVIGKTFKWDYLTHYLTSDVLPIFAWIAIAIIGFIPAEFLPQGVIPIVADVVYATVALTILGSLYESFKSIGVLNKPTPPIG